MSHEPKVPPEGVEGLEEEGDELLRPQNLATLRTLYEEQEGDPAARARLGGALFRTLCRGKATREASVREARVGELKTLTEAHADDDGLRGMLVMGL